MQVRRVLIVGGGPAGLVAAIALTRVGVEALVVELQDGFTAAGIGVNLQNAPLRALDSLGLLDEIEGQGYPTGVVNMLTMDGRPMMPPLRPPSLVPGRPAAIGIGRGELSAILAARAGADGILTRFGLTVDRLTDVGDGVRATFSDGTSEVFDLVVGADGVHSRVRELAFGPAAPGPQYTGQAIWRAAAPRGDLDEYQMLNGPVSKVGLVPISADRMYLYLVEAFESEPDRRDFGDLDEALQRALLPFGGDVPAVAARLERGADLRAFTSLLLEDPWYRGRVLLIGDAAHATTPHISYGLGLAIEDGIVLAELLGRHGDVAAALPEFMRRRFDRCALVVRNSRQLGAWEQDPTADRQAYGALMNASLEALAQPV